MKKLLLLILLFSGLYSYSQADTVYKTDGEKLIISIVDVQTNTVNSCLDFDNVEISYLESETLGLFKIDDICMVIEAKTELSKLSKLHQKAFNSIKYKSAFLGGNVAFIAYQKTDNGNEMHYKSSNVLISGSKAANVVLSGISYTSNKVLIKDINEGKYNIIEAYEFHNDFKKLVPRYLFNQVFEIWHNDLIQDRNFVKIKSIDCIKGIKEYNIIFAKNNKLILSGVITKQNGKKTYYNLFLVKT